MPDPGFAARGVSPTLSFEAGWDLLPPGVYRLVHEMNDGKLIFCEFSI